ncbi:MAG: hypothetical protein QOJ40_56, partial [Verrucomicrobiota bacterium]
TADTGGMTVNGSGTFYVSSIGNSSGNLKGVVTVNSGATLELQDYTSFGNNTISETLTLNGGTIQVDASTAFQANITGYFLAEGGVTLAAGGGTFAPQYTGAIWSSQNLSSAPKITGTGQLTVAGTGSLTMSSPAGNTYSGGTVVVGKLTVSTAGNLGPGPVTVNSGGTLTLANNVFPSAQKLLLQAGTPVVNLTGANTVSQLSFDGGATFQANGTWGSPTNTGSATYTDNRFTGTGTINVNTGTTKVWNGAGADDNWSTALNWTTGIAVVGNDDVQFDGNTRLTPNMENTYTLKSLTFNTNAGSFVLTSAAGKTLTLASATASIVNNSANDQAIVLQIAQGSTKLVVNTGIQGKKITYTKALGNTSADNNGMTLNGNGTFWVTSVGAASGELLGVVLVNNGATLELQDYTSFGGNSGAETLVLDGGTIQVDASSAFQANLTGHFLCEGGVTLNAGGGTFAPEYAAIWSSQNLVSPSVFKISGAGQLTVAGDGSLTMSSPTANTYSGGTLVTGTLIVSTNNNLGSGPSVTVASGGTLTLANAVFPSAQKLLLQAGASAVNLTGTNTVSQLSFDGGATFQAAGSWGSSGSSATHTDDTRFSGTGMLNVTTGPVLPFISPLVGAGTANAQITWSSVNGQTYQVQFKTNLDDPAWSVLSNLTATGASTTIADTTTPPASQRFYRIATP